MKHMKLILVAAMCLTAQQACAKNESGWMKKTARVSWHAVQLASGLVFLNKWHTMTDGHCSPCSKRNGFDCDRGPFIVASATLIWYGLRGLNKELHLREQFKK